MTIDGKHDPRFPIAIALNTSSLKSYASPWLDGVKDQEDEWHLPEYDCEIPNLGEFDERNKKWTPGTWIPGVDNVEQDANGKIIEYGGQKMWAGESKPADWDRVVARMPDRVQDLLKVPHMPRQPAKEMFARLKALQPEMFEDKYYEEIFRYIHVKDYMKRRRFAMHKEKFGIHTEQESGDWEGQEDQCTPAVYTTPRPDTVTICVGIAGHLASSEDIIAEIPGAEFDYLEYLYAKDQEGKIIQIQPGENRGINRCIFHSYSFVPPFGTTKIVPFASFKIRGAWKGASIEWDPKVGSNAREMQWFNEMSLELRKELTSTGALSSNLKKQLLNIKYPKSEKKMKPVVWPENSWEGNAAKARHWDEIAAKR